MDGTGGPEANTEILESLSRRRSGSGIRHVGRIGSHENTAARIREDPNVPNPSSGRLQLRHVPAFGVRSQVRKATDGRDDDHACRSLQTT